MNKMDILNELDQILNNRYLVSGNEIVEKNLKKNQKPFENKYKVICDGQNNDFRIYRFDDTCFPFFNKTKNLKKMCDYIIFYKEANHLFVNLFELKDGDLSGCKAQLLAGKEFINYIESKAKRLGFDINITSIKLLGISAKHLTKPNTKIKFELVLDKDDYSQYRFKNIYLKLINN